MLELVGPENNSNSKRRERLLHVATVPGVAPERLNLGTLAALVKEIPVYKWAQPRLVGCLRIDDHLSICPCKSKLLMDSPVFFLNASQQRGRPISESLREEERKQCV